MYQRVWSDFQDMPQSAMFKTMGPGFLGKIGQYFSFRIHAKSTQTVAEAVRSYFRRVLEAYQRVWSDFQDMAKSAMFKTDFPHLPKSAFLKPWSRVFAQNRPISDPWQFSRNLLEQAPKKLEIHLEACRRPSEGVWDDFPALPKSVFFKTMGYSPGFLLKIGRLRTFGNSHGIF